MSETLTVTLGEWSEVIAVESEDQDWKQDLLGLYFLVAQQLLAEDNFVKTDFSKGVATFSKVTAEARQLGYPQVGMPEGDWTDAY